MRNRNQLVFTNKLWSFNRWERSGMEIGRNMWHIGLHASVWWIPQALACDRPRRHVWNTGVCIHEPYLLQPGYWKGLQDRCKIYVAVAGGIRSRSRHLCSFPKWAADRRHRRFVCSTGHETPRTWGDQIQKRLYWRYKDRSKRKQIYFCGYERFAQMALLLLHDMVSHGARVVFTYHFAPLKGFFITINHPSVSVNCGMTADNRSFLL